MSENNGLQEMYEYQEMKDKASGEEYVVRGAEVFCGYGNKSCVLNLPKDHGIYTSDGRPLITVSDTKPRNIRGLEHAVQTGNILVNVNRSWDHGKIMEVLI